MRNLIVAALLLGAAVLAPRAASAAGCRVLAPVPEADSRFQTTAYRAPTASDRAQAQRIVRISSAEIAAFETCTDADIDDGPADEGRSAMYLERALGEFMLRRVAWHDDANRALQLATRCEAEHYGSAGGAACASMAQLTAQAITTFRFAEMSAR